MKKTFLVIGAGPGIGLATAAKFARERFRVVLTSRHADVLRTHAQRMLGDDADWEVESVDATDGSAVGAVVARHAPDVVHYNAGVLRYRDGALETTPITTFDDRTIQADIQVNLASALVAMRSAITVMEPRGAGTILVTGGGLAVKPNANLLTLSAGKAGLRAAVEALFEPLKAKHIHIANVAVSTLVDPATGAEKAARIAEAFWMLHRQPEAEWTWENVYA